MNDGNQTIASTDHTNVIISAPDRPTAAGRVRRGALAALTTLALVGVGVACGSDGEDGGPNTEALSEQAQRGLELANSNGCAACHGTNWTGGTGPPLVGLFGTEVTLNDGSVVIADEEYLTLAIAEPAAQMLADYSLRMPANDLDDDEIADVVQFIEEIGPSSAATDPAPDDE